MPFLELCWQVTEELGQEKQPACGERHAPDFLDAQAALACEKVSLASWVV